MNHYTDKINERILRRTIYSIRIDDRELELLCGNIRHHNAVNTAVNYEQYRKVYSAFKK